MPEQRIADFVKTGEGDVTILLLHGGYGSKEYFRYQIETLVRAGYRTVAWDAPGYGISPRPDPFTIEGVADAAVRLIEHDGADRYVIMGHSMGGLIAPRVANALPGKVEAVVLSATLASLGQGGEAFARDFIEKRIPPLRQHKTLEGAAMPLLKTMFYEKSSGPMCDLVLKIAASTPSESFIQAMLAIQKYRGEPVLEALQIPALCVAGRHDPVAQWKMMQDMSAMIPKGEFKVFEESGHYPFAEQHADFNAVLFDFLKRAGCAPN